MGKKILTIFIIAFIALFALSSLNFASQDFDGLFTMDVPLGQHYSNVAWCKPSGGLGCLNEYWEDNAGCDIEEGDMVIYYYNNSGLVDNEANAREHALNTLTTSYMYEYNGNDGDLIVLTNDIDMKAMPPYLVGKSSGDDSEIAFVGGKNLDDIKRYAGTIEF